MSELEIYKGIVKKMKDDEKKTKRIIEKIEGLATYVTIPRELAIYNVNIDSQEAKLLTDYITNLQQENKELNGKIKTLENNCKQAQNSCRQHRLASKNHIRRLQRREKQIEDYKSRCEKANEKIKSFNLISGFRGGKTIISKLLYDLDNILNGKE